MVLSRPEISRLIGLMKPPYDLMAILIYGGGLRLRECLSLRVKDIDLEARILTVRSGKGDKDRQTLLSTSAAVLLEKHIQNQRHLFDEDQRENHPGVMLPTALERKYPGAGKEWAWFWAFPAPRQSVEPRTETVRRYHLYPS
ncbi:MAG: tyrosine-type recombinase/integrase, partial [Spirochaetaceae bacterium]|nr:tyrosine-type recombinase/integrase [Spirochaetaceae bacterium]